MNTSKPSGFVGLGVMGRPMAAHLACAGYAIKLARWVERRTHLEITPGATRPA